MFVRNLAAFTGSVGGGERSHDHVFVACALEQRR